MRKILITVMLLGFMIGCADKYVAPSGCSVGYKVKGCDTDPSNPYHTVPEQK